MDKAIEEIASKCMYHDDLDREKTKAVLEALLSNTQDQQELHNPFLTRGVKTDARTSNLLNKIVTKPPDTVEPIGKVFGDLGYNFIKVQLIGKPELRLFDKFYSQDQFDTLKAERDSIYKDLQIELQTSNTYYKQIERLSRIENKLTSENQRYRGLLNSFHSYFYNCGCPSELEDEAKQLDEMFKDNQPPLQENKDADRN